MSQAWPRVPSDTGWITPTLAAGWATPAGNFAPLRYRRVDGVVEMQGAATGPTSGDLFTLPVGFRPDIGSGEESIFAVNAGLSTAAVTRVVIRANGTVSVVGGTVPTFDAVRFRAI